MANVISKIRFSHVSPYVFVHNILVKKNELVQSDGNLCRAYVNWKKVM